MRTAWKVFTVLAAIVSPFPVASIAQDMGSETNPMLLIAGPSLLVERSRQLILAQRCLQSGRSVMASEVEALTGQVASLASKLNDEARRNAKAQIDYGPQPLVTDFNCSMLHRELLNRAHPPSDSLPF